MNRWAGSKILGSVLVVCFAAPAASQGARNADRSPLVRDEISLAYEYVWTGRQAYGSFVPIRFEITNPLRDDEGMLTVTYGSYQVHYPVQLPSNSVRSFIAYIPAQDYYFDPVVELRCRQQKIKFELSLPSSGYETTYDVALISDSPSLLTFLRTVEIEIEESDEYVLQKTTFQDFAVLPQMAPDRAVGYDGMDLVVLGEGSERMTDAVVAAVQRYVLAGGSVLFLGGAVAPVLRDARWAAYIPGENPRVVNLSGSTVVSEATGVPMTRTFTATQLDPIAGTTGLEENGVPIVWYRRCGLGLAIYWAFDPFQQPFQSYAGRAGLFETTVSALGAGVSEYIAAVGASLDNDMSDPYGYSGYYGYSDQSDSVFQVEMPPTEKVFLILAAYFICVVPLNFLILKKLNRGEYAWITSPIIGLAFAGVFFLIASDLYSAGLARSTNGLVVAHQGSTVAYGFGNQELFFPSGGRYDLKFSGIEAIANSYVDMWDMGDTSGTGFGGDLYDVGEIVATRAAVSNLAFREIHFRQALDWPYRIPLNLELISAGSNVQAVGSILNDTPYTMHDAQLYLGSRQIYLGTIESGALTSIDTLAVSTRFPDGPYYSAPVGEGQVVLSATLEGVELGAVVGKEQQRGVQLFYTFSGVSAEVVDPE